MREAAHSFPLQNRAAITSSSSLYDRRSIDNALPTLPLLNSLQSLAYLTSTSPRIREILTLDGGLERLISIVGGCLDIAFPHSVDPARKVAGRRSAHPKSRRAVPFKPFSAYSPSNAATGYRYVDQHALLHTYGFALQCLVNVGVRGSEQIRTRVVEAGVLQIVARILSGFLATRQKERERRSAQTEPSRSVTLWRDDAAAATPRASHVQLVQPTPAQPATLPPSASRLPHLPLHRTNTPDTIASIDETEQEHENTDVDNENEAESSGQENENDEEKMDTEEEGTAEAAVARGRRGTIIKRSNGSMRTGADADADPTPTPADHESNGDVIMDSVTAEQVSAQAATNASHASTVDAIENAMMHPQDSAIDHSMESIMHAGNAFSSFQSPSIVPATNSSMSSSASASSAPYTPLQDHHYKEDDVLHCLQVLAYLSKYPHVRAVFHDPENESARPPPPSTPVSSSSSSSAREASPRKKQRCGENGESCCTMTGCKGPGGSSSTSRNGVLQHSCCHNHDDGEEHDGGCEGEGMTCQEAEELARAKALASIPAKDRKPALEPSRPPRSTANNVFSLVEQFTFRPSSPTERSMRLPTEIQYWSGVIMRNACRKDELRGGIRQCANMGCGIWERFPREFAKCRRCRKAKYCSKSCQRKAWQSGHRYWCSARQDPPLNGSGSGGGNSANAHGQHNTSNASGAGATPRGTDQNGLSLPHHHNHRATEDDDEEGGDGINRMVDEEDDEGAILGIGGGGGGEGVGGGAGGAVTIGGARTPMIQMHDGDDVHLRDILGDVNGGAGVGVVGEL